MLICDLCVSIREKKLYYNRYKHGPSEQFKPKTNCGAQPVPKSNFCEFWQSHDLLGNLVTDKNGKCIETMLEVIFRPNYHMERILFTPSMTNYYTQPYLLHSTNVLLTV